MEKKQISLSVFLCLARWLSWRVSVWVFVFTYPGGCLCVFLTTRSLTLCLCPVICVAVGSGVNPREKYCFPVCTCPSSNFMDLRNDVEGSMVMIDGLCCGWVTRIEVYLTKNLCLGQWGAMIRPCFSVPRSWRRGHWTEFDSMYMR